ncbi:MAG: Bcr/CflA family drug resistance efflux transporter [Curvibacter sp. GWA2_64_110]|nr:MAG: Bcr/CflA family drug resistance efflux transporter [Curvibacter sp. GWA2_64_110]HCY16223.1 Bcr/CflA family drug resistance efflux transporter [Curvibacter sp.]
MSVSASATPVSPAGAMSSALVVLILSLLLGLQPITTDLYLPALPALTEGFGATLAQAQLTLTAMLLSFGLSQLVWGPLSDRFGRRPILLWGLGAYVLASVASALAPSMELLIVARIVQGAAMGAGVMCARAIVRDLYRPVEGARMMSKGLTGLGVIACMSAPLGGLLSDWMNWRVALLVLTVFSVVTLAVVALRFEETLTQKNPQALQPATLLSTWAGILRHPTFWAFSALSTASYGGLFTFLASSSFIFIKVLQIPKPQYGLLMFTVSFAYILGTLICRRLLPRWGVRRTVAVAGGFTLAGGTLMGALALAGLHNGWAIMLPFYLFMLAHGVHQPCSQSGAVGPFPYAAGAASALNGFLMMAAAFVVGGWLGTHMDGTVMPLVYGVWFWSVVIAVSAWTLVQKHGKTGDH